MARIGILTQTLTIAGLLGALAGPTAQAAPMTTNQVRAMTGNWLAGSDELQGRQIRQLRPLAWQAAAPVFYLAELDGRGWLLTSADDALQPVLGWSDQPLAEGELPPALIDWLKTVEEETIRLRAKGGESAPARQSWQGLLAGAADATPLLTDPSDVQPLLEAVWSQGVNFNESCPTDAAGPGGHAFVGCVAVAMAQVMDYWNWPVQGAGTQSYTHTVYGPISVDFSQASYDWNAITPIGGNADVQRLLYHAGVSVRMNYGPGLSTAQSSMIPNSLRTYFHYQSTTRMIWRNAYTAQGWRDMLHTELSAGRPIIYRGQGASGGHAFDVDGIQDSTWFHINWGWTGNYNGWFELTDLSPGNYTFNDLQGAVIGIAPDGVSINHQPVVPILYLQGAANQTISAMLTGFDEDGDPLTFRVDGTPLAGNVWTWTPPQGANGTYTFSYQACDASSCSTPAGITVAITGVNQPPTAVDMAVDTPENVPVSVTLLGSDPDGDALTYRVEGQPIAGNVWTWIPPQDTHGVFTFGYQACDANGCSTTAHVSVTVRHLNHLPRVVDLLVETEENHPVNVVLVGSDEDNDPLTFLVDGQNLPGDAWNWTPPADSHGNFSFTYRAHDGTGASDPATLTVVVNHTNHLPVVSPLTFQGVAGLTMIMTLSASDPDGDALTYRVNGTELVGDQFSWTPTAAGSFTFTYQACDAVGCSASADITVIAAAVNHLPTVVDRQVETPEGQTVSLNLEGSDVDGDSLTFAIEGVALIGSEFTWTPEPDARGSFTFSYQACDAVGCGVPATLTVVVVEVNQTPLAAPMLVEGLEDESLTITLAGFDADGDTLSYQVNGTALVGNQFSWTPAPNATGDFLFNYQACDGALCSEVATLTVRILPVNDTPIARPVSTHLRAPGLQHIQLVAWDLDHDSLTYVVDGVPQASSIFTAQIEQNSPLSFSYYVTDGQACSDTVAVELSFAPKDDILNPQPEDELNTGATPLGEGLAMVEPASTSLRPAYPNPFNPTTTIGFQLAATANVRLTIYNVLGQQVTVLVDGLVESGRHELRWDGSGVASGAYLAVLQTPEGLQTQILQLVK